MISQIAFSIADKHVIEESGLDVGIKFLDSTGDLSIPLNSKYRIDCLATGNQLADWTDVGSVSSATITVTAMQNSIQNNTRLYEKKQMTVASDYGLDTQYLDSVVWTVKNVAGT